MARNVPTSRPLPHEEDEENAQEELSDEQIQQLLKEATARLTSPQQHDQRISAPTQISGRLIPKLQNTNAHAPYIREVNGVAIADPKLLISEEQRKLSDNLRDVDTAAPSKKLVGFILIHIATSHEENNPNISLDADQLSVMASPAPMRDIIIHSYSDFTKSALFVRTHLSA